MKRTLKCFSALFLFAFLFPTYANNTLIPVEAYGALPSTSLFSISPSGQLVAFRDVSGEYDLLVVQNRMNGELIRAARIDNINPNTLYFVSDNVVILVATKNIKLPGYKGRHDSSWAYAFNLETGGINALLEQGFGIYKGQTQLGRIIGISPDKKYAFMPAYESPGRYNLYKVNLENKRKPKVYQRGTADTDDFFLNNQGEVIARERFNNEENLHRIEARINDEWVEIYREETDIRTKGFSGVTSDQQHLVFSSYSDYSDRRAYYTMALADGSISAPLFHDDNKDVSHLITDLQRVVHGAAFSGFEPSYYFFDEKLNARMRGINKAMPENSFAIKDYSDNWQNIIFFMQGKDSVGEYILYAKGALQLLASSRPDIPVDSVSPVVEQVITARDGLKIPTLVTIPRGKTASKLPAIVMPHGGPASHDSKGFDYLAQFFANRGFIVIQPQFRGSSGFGRAFRYAGHGEWGRKMQDDVTDTVLALTEEGKIDPQRVCIVGGSYGGYAALAGAAFTPELYRCAVSINGVSDVERMLKDERKDYGSDHWVVAYWEDAISRGEVDESHLAAISPINHVSQIQAPILLIHGEYDESVPIKQSERMLDALEDADKTVEFLELEDGNHFLSSAQNRMRAMQAIAAFVEKHMQ
ncbi:alpha/beta hydrolase family protein [Alteromonas flava]|uniref:alpha/beta hydrolase family protein n=1 Tax=Alteromonas flava TaxID=2048003 RepID=UPI000C288583|nr:alpha/beta fold hydrolase [Alteromonas flava]